MFILRTNFFSDWSYKYVEKLWSTSRNKSNQIWSYIPDHPYGILIIGGSGSRKTNNTLIITQDQ